MGDAGQEIVATARRSGADVIVVGRGGDRSHAEVPAGALCVGSAARLVLWAAPCPVLVLPLDRAARPEAVFDRPGRRSFRAKGGVATLESRHRARVALLRGGAGPDDAA
jgi:hypothetical protein